MSNSGTKTDHLKPFQVRTPEQGRALAALGSGRPQLPRPVKPWSGKLYADQLGQLSRRRVNVSALVRELLDDWIASNSDE